MFHRIAVGRGRRADVWRLGKWYSIQAIGDDGKLYDYEFIISDDLLLHMVTFEGDEYENLYDN